MMGNRPALKLIKKRILSHWQFYAIFFLPLLYIIVFAYIPMPGVLMGFQRYSVSRGVFGSPWVGLRHFRQFFASPSSFNIILNTLRLGVYSLVAGFPIPIILALALNEVGSKFFKKTVQMVTYAPYFISTVVVVGMIMQMSDLRYGLFNKIGVLFGGSAVNLMASPGFFPHIYVWSGIWQVAGYSAVIYLAALAGVDRELQEAARVDGVTRIQRIRYVDLPSITPQIIILLIFGVGSVMGIGFEKAFLMQNNLNLSRSEIIATFVYKTGLVNSDYSFATAVGLFNSLVSIVLLVSTNTIAKKFTETSLW